ncbi:MAG: Nif3-like dinuclear metal center hexameric protein [Tissierellia bacterium]|nr:Nif3-like dinuclear metal center hexameric protein [Tissierellia bacterium]
MKLEEVIAYMDSWAPEESQEDWDNSGPQIYFKDQDLKGILVCMDINQAAYKKAKDLGCNLLISHHPLFFSPIKSLREDSYKGQLVMDLIQSRIQVYSAHTNLDKATDGVNHQWLALLKLSQVEKLSEEDGIGLVGQGEWTLEDLDGLFKDLGFRHVRYYGKKRAYFNRLAICGGSGADYLEEAKAKGAQVLITGDVKYHQGQRAYEEGMTLIDLGHFESESLILDRISSRLKVAFPHVAIYTHKEADYSFEIDP